MRIVFAGTPEFSVPALQALIESPHEVVGVLTQPDRPSGRGRKLAASAVKQAAARAALPLAQPPTLKDGAVRAQLLAWRPDVMVVVAYGLILPRDVLGLPPLGCLNIHASLLPRWRGAAPIQRAILAGDAQTGVTIMQMEAGLDTGPMLLQRREPIGSRDTSGSLHDRLSRLGAAALIEVIGGLAAGTPPRGITQPSEGASYAVKIDKAEASIDWREDAADIDRKVRAFHPWPVAETRFAGEQLRIVSAVLPPSGNNDVIFDQIDPNLIQSGTAYALADDGLRISCGRGTLTITEVQRPGKRPIAARDFVHACDVVGQRLG